MKTIGSQPLPTTTRAILSTDTALLEADPTLDTDARRHIMAAIRDALTGKIDKAGTPTPRPLVKRSELKRLSGLSGVSLDRYARRGYLIRVHLGGSSRASGFDAASVDAFLAGRATATADGNQADKVKGGVA